MSMNPEASPLGFNRDILGGVAGSKLAQPVVEQAPAGLAGLGGAIARLITNAARSNFASFEGKSPILEGKDYRAELRHQKGNVRSDLFPSSENAKEHKGARTVDFYGNPIISNGEEWVLDPEYMRAFRGEPPEDREGFQASKNPTRTRQTKKRR